MARKNRIGLQFTGWKEVLAGIDKLRNESALKDAVDDALKASKDHVNRKVNKVMVKSNLPAKGKYSRSPHTTDSLDRNFNVNWSGYTGEIKVGFDLEKSGLVSIFLMYGTPQHEPVPGLQDAFYSKKTKSEIRKIQKEAIDKFIKRHLGG